MTIRPQLPSLDTIVADLLKRIAILEALFPNSNLQVDNGSTVIFPTSRITLDPESFTLTNPAGGEAHIALPDFADYTPVLTSNGTDPTLGAGSTFSGRVGRLGNLAIVNGVIVIDTSGFSVGTGVWQVSLPLPFVGPGNVGAKGSINNLSANTFWELTPQPDVNASDSQITFSYAGSYPFGSYEQLPGAWVFNDNDRLEWALVYETHD